VLATTVLAMALLTWALLAVAGSATRRTWQPFPHARGPLASGGKDSPSIAYVTGELAALPADPGTAGTTNADDTPRCRISPPNANPPAAASKESKDEVTQRYLAGFAGTEGVLYVGRAQEKAAVWRIQRRHNADGSSWRMPLL